MLTETPRFNPIKLLIYIIIALIIAVTVFLIKNIYDYTSTEYQKMLHPLSYSEYVEKYSNEFGVDKNLIYSVIKVESNFNPDAVSNVGARGLMQIMEDTFDWIKYRLDDDESAYENMFDAETNIRYGTYLLSYNIDYFGDTTCAVAAYHAGTSGVERWLSNSEYSKNGRTLDKMPNSDTEHYVDKVKNANKKYIELYTEKK